MSLRQQRVNKQLVQQISEIVVRMKDPRLGFVTITDSSVSPDLRSARIAVSVLAEPEERKATIEVLQKAEGFIRNQLGKTTHMKTVPALEFFLDEGAIASARVQEILRKLEIEQDPAETD